MSDLEGNFDVIILGTGLVESIAAAALSKAGFKVAHLDNNSYYGGDEANLTLDELARWADNRSTPLEKYEKISSYLVAQRTKFTSITRSSAVPDHARHYSISLAPSLIPSVGPFISSLIASGVSRYGGYRLLERVGIYSSSKGLQNVPGSKGDIFKSTLSLIEKRRLMRFFKFATGKFESSNELQGHEQTPFPEFLQSKFSLPQEIVDAIVYALAFCASTADVTLHALTRLRNYFQSAGRYGASPFLVGHYGGLGEIAQGFCRVSAVNGGVYILDKKTEDITPPSTSADKFVAHLADFPSPLTAGVLIAADDQLPESLQPLLTKAQNTDESLMARCIAIIDQPILFPPVLSSEGLSGDGVNFAPVSSGEEDAGGQSSASTRLASALAEAPLVDTSIIIFPPCSVEGGSSIKVAQAFTTGAGTFSAPEGKYVVYVSIPIKDGEDPEALMEPYLNTVFSLASVSEPLFKVAYVQHISFPSSSTPTIDLPPIFVTPALPPHVAEISDYANSAAESLFNRVVDHLKAKIPQAWTRERSGEEGGGDGDVFAEIMVPMWPPLGDEEEAGEDE
ncbi:FAD/NAD-P-binding domain-containing protein [Russula earlei]|uniref:FAD/NAD-P-binding domain-containing protein n=1 Tax=Russula earlei TaxID=71964 RepID=A0ACC0U8K4_9AGAM|nr:FAD/NAD-P-binding domain-containing protein [Russula earlei]